ncbi:MAG: ATP synthase F1 subunit delta [Phycisphaerales bacterium]|nr:ATP synthase F1 subunit delta [Phycisphaerales bacterium]
MPMIDSQPDALARLYARSLFELANEKGGRAAIEETGAELGEVVELARHDKRFGEFLSSRIVPTDKRDASLTRIFQGRISDLTLRFLQVLNEKDRLSHLSVIAAAYDEQVQEQFGLVEVDVYTAAPIDADLRERVAAALRKAMGKEPVIHSYTDEAMLGGLKLQIGDQLIDASIATRLRRMRERLNGPGGAQMRARMNEIIEGKGV